MKKEIIALCGNISSGKSSVGEKLSQVLSMEHYKASDKFRSWAREADMTLVEYNEYVKKNPELDRKMEMSTGEYAKEHNKIIIDARLGFFVVPYSFKVYLSVDLDTATSRMMGDLVRRGEEEKYSSFAEAKQAIISRENAERDRYLKLYGVDIRDKKNFDLIVDTSHLTPDEVVNKIVSEYKLWLEK